MSRNNTRWERVSEHGPKCNGCRKVAGYAKTEAIVTGAESATWTEDGHTVTVTRPAHKTN